MTPVPTLEDLPGWARGLLEDQRVGRLGLIDDAGRPRVLPVTFAVHEAAVWTAVDNKPKRGPELARVRWLRARPAATLVVDRYDDDWSQLAWVQLIGEMSIVEGPPSAAVLNALARRYPQYRGDPPPGPALRLTVGRTVCWRAA